MQTIYATHLPLSSPGHEEPVVQAVRAVAEWLSIRFDVSLSLDASKADIRDEEKRISWQTRSGRAGALWQATVDHNNRDDPLWRWLLQVFIGHGADGGWLRVRVNLYSSLEGLVLEPRVHRGRPRLVKTLSDQLHLTIDRWRLDESREVTPVDVGEYVAFLRDHGRKLPVVTMSTNANGRPFLNERHLADKLMGLAHVAWIGQDASYRVSEMIGSDLSCYRGAVRIYWPRFSLQDDKQYHTLYTARRLDFLGKVGLQDELFTRLGQLSALSVGIPVLREKLIEEERDQERRRLRVELDEATKRAVRAEKSPDGGVDAETWSAFAADYDKAQARLEELQLALLDAQIEIETVRSERDEARVSLGDLISRFQRGADVVVERPEQDRKLDSVGEAVRVAMQRTSSIVFLPEALESAEESRFPDPPRVLDDLLFIDGVATEWGQGGLPHGPHQALKERCSAFRPGISPTAANKYRSDYVRYYEDHEILLGPHISRGKGALTEILRIYFYFDTERQRIVVGHVGRKLRDASNSN